MSLNFCQIPLPTREIAAFERLKNECIMLWAFLIESYSFLQVHVTRTVIKSWIGSKFSKIKHWSTELSALERLKKSPYTYNGSNVVSTLVLLFSMDRSSSFSQVSRTTIKALMSLMFGHIGPPTIKLADLECLKYSSIMT